MSSSKQSPLYDLVIIGGAAVGCAAAVYAARRGLNFIVVTKDIGGEVALSGDVDNWPGIIHTDGVKLAQDFHKHALSYGVQFDTGYEITSISPQKNHHVVAAVNDNGETKKYKTKTVIIGSGIHPRKLGIPGEDTLKGKGITSCTVCDGPLFKGKVTATIGAGNSALESALMMTGIAKKVYVITKFPDTKETNGGFPKGEFILIAKVKKLPNVEIMYQASTKEILGETKVTGLVYEDTGSKKSKTIAVDAVMVHIGMIPNSSFVKNLKQNPLGEILVDKLGKTSELGIFAAGDVTDVPYKQIAIAAGQGVTAALSAIDYINKWSEK
jgi:alkyl hydroperoxide reductase subunit AhpF